MNHPSALEVVLRELWLQYLPIEEVVDSTDFFAEKGDSFAMIQIAASLADAFPDYGQIDDALFEALFDFSEFGQVLRQLQLRYERSTGEN